MSRLNRSPWSPESSSSGHTGRWEITDTGERRLRMTWSHGYVDDLTAQPGGRRLDGRNQEGTVVWGERATGATNDRRTPAGTWAFNVPPPAGDAAPAASTHPAWITDIRRDRACG